MSKDAKNKESAMCSAEDTREDLGEMVTQRFVESTAQETFEMESEENKKKCGKGKVGLL